MAKPTTKYPLGPVHTASIRRVADVPKAAKGHFNSTPGTREKPVIIAGKEPKK